MKTTRKLFALLLTVVMLLGMIPTAQAQTIWCPDMGWEHKWGPTETIDGSCWGLHFCTVCGAGDEVPLGHKWRETIVEEPWCEVGGMKAMICSVCGEWQNNGTPLAPLGHNWGGWQWVHGYAADCTTGAWQVRECKRCGQMEDRYIDKTGHKFGEWIVTQEPTCTERGRQHHVCSVCKYSEWEPIDTIDHVFGDWRVIEEPQVGIPGTERRACTFGCGTHEDREIPPLEPAIALEGLELTLTLDSTPANGKFFVLGEEIVLTVNWANNSDQYLHPCWVSIWPYEQPTMDSMPLSWARSWDSEETGPVAPGDGGTFSYVGNVTDGYIANGGLHAMAVIVSTVYNGPEVEDVMTPFVTAPCGVEEDVNEEPVSADGLELTLVLSSTPANGTHFVVGEKVTFTETWVNNTDKTLYPFSVSIFTCAAPVYGSEVDQICSWFAEDYGGPVAPGATNSHTLTVTVTEADVARGAIYAQAELLSTVLDGPDLENVATPYVTAPCAPVAGSDYTTSIKLEVLDVPSVTAEWAGDVYPVKVKVTNTGDTTVSLYGHLFSDSNNVHYPNAILYDWNKYQDTPRRDWLPAGESLTTDIEFAVTQDGIKAGELRFNFTQFAEPWYVQVGNVETNIPADIVAEPEGATGYYGKRDEVVTDTVEIVVPINQGTAEFDPEGLTVTKTASAGDYSDPCKPGDEVVFTITVTNNTGVELTDVEITDPVKGGNEDSVVDIIPSMQPGESVTASFSYTVTEEDATVGVEGFENTAYASGYTADGTQVSGKSETIFVWCVIEHELTFSKSIANVPANGEFFVPGETIVFKISMFDHTPYPLYNIVLTDPLCQDQYIYDAVNDMSYLYFGELYNEGNAMGESTSATVTVSYVVTEADAEAGSVTNTAEVTYQTWYGKEITDSASATAPCGSGEPMNSAGVRLEKELRNAPANGEYYVPGEVLNYALTLRLDDCLLLDDAAIYDPIAGGDGLVISYGKGLYGGMGMDVFYVVTEEDAQRGYVENTAYATWIYQDSGEAGRCESETVIAVCGMGELPEDYEAPGLLEITTVATTTPANGSYYTEGETVILADVFTNRSANLTLTGSDWVNVEILGKGIFNRNDNFGADAVLAPGETKTLLTSEYVITAEDVAQGYIQKTVHAGFADEKDRFYTGSFEIRIPCAPEAEAGLIVQKTCITPYAEGTNYFVPGDEITYEITVTNNTGEALYDVEISDPLKGGNEDAIIDRIPEMMVGDSVTVTFTYVPTIEDAHPVNGEHILNTAYAMGYTVLGEQVNGTSNTVEVALLYLGEVKLSKTVVNTPANGMHFVPGETIEFVIDVVNDTYYPFYDPILLDPLCEDQYVYDAPNEMSYLCYFDGQLRNDRDNVWAIPVTYVVTEEDAANGYVTNTAEMDYMTFNGVRLQASASATAPCGPADTQPIAVVKSVGNTPADPEGFMFGEVIEFTISVTNNLPETVPHINLVDPLIPDWSYDVYALEPGATASTTVSYTVNILDCFNGSVENYVSGRAVVSDGYRFLRSNTVSAACREVTILNVRPADGPFGVITDLEVTKEVESLPLNGLYYTEGETVAYRITYVNIGETPLTDVMIYDALAGIDEIAAAEKLEPGESRTCFFNYTVTAEDVARGYIANVAVGQYDVNGYLNSVHSDVVVVDTDGQPDPEFPEGVLPPSGSIDTGALNGNMYCFRSSSSRTNVSYSWGTSFCLDHEGIQGAILMMEKAAATPEAKLQTAAYAIEMWRAEVEKLYQELLDAADPQARAVIMAEYVTFLTHASNYETLLKAILADQPEVAAKKLAKLWEEKCITLCFEMHAPVSARQDSFLSVEVATMEAISDACACVTYQEDKGWNGVEQTYCPAHSFPFAMTDMLLDGQDTAEAWTTVRQIWQVELRGAYNKVIDALGEKSDVAMAEYATLESWMTAREAELKLLYPENPELVAQTMVRIAIDQVNALCQTMQ